MAVAPESKGISVAELKAQVDRLEANPTPAWRFLRALNRASLHAEHGNISVSLIDGAALEAACIAAGIPRRVKP